MLEIIGLIILTLALPVLINKSTETHFEWVKPYLRLLWTAVLAFYSVYLLNRQEVVGVAMRLHSRLGMHTLTGYALAAITGAALLCAYWWFTGMVFTRQTMTHPAPEADSNRPHQHTANAGRLTPAHVLWSGKDGALPPRLEIGDSGIILESGRADLPLFQLIPFVKKSRLIVESSGGRLLVSTEVRNKNGDLIAELNRNEWSVAPPPATWDRNYSDDALEVRDPQGKIVLQVVALPDRIQLQGEWWDDSATGMRIVKTIDPQTRKPAGAVMLLKPPKYNPDQPSVQSIFEYPSSLHFGERKAR